VGIGVEESVCRVGFLSCVTVAGRLFQIRRVLESAVVIDFCFEWACSGGYSVA
jgi:hypothetical protein